MTERDERESEIDIFNEPRPATENQNAARTRPGETEVNGGLTNDHQLLGAYVQGDERAFEILVEKYFRMVHTVAARRTGDSYLAEDIAQSVFLILSRKAGEFSPNRSVPGWLMRTTRFVCRDAIKMRRRRDQNERKLARTIESRLEMNPQPGNLELLVEEALQTLRPEEQAGIMARFFEGKNFQEMAEMFAITEPTARKRTSRSLAKLQRFLAKRGFKVVLPTLLGLLAARASNAATNQALQSAIEAAHAIWKGKVATGNAVAMADRTMRVLRWRFLAGLSVKLALPVALILVGVWLAREWSHSAPERIEKLGQAWGALAEQVARHRQFLMQTSPDTPNYQARVQEELGAIGRESSRIIGEVKPLLTPPNERARLAEFLTAELGETLNLDRSRKTALFTYIQGRLAQGATLNDGMKTLAQTTEAEAAEIKTMLSPEQRQVFDQTYGADGVLLFSYAKAVALGQIGP
jgi:RNA polymerase sigma factor (sigma-70 family)